MQPASIHLLHPCIAATTAVRCLRCAGSARSRPWTCWQCWLGALLVYVVQQQGPTISFVEQQPPSPWRCSGCLRWSARARRSSGSGAWWQRRWSSGSLAVPACVRHAIVARLRLCCLSRASRRCATAGREDCMAQLHNILERQLHRVALSRCYEWALRARVHVHPGRVKWCEL